MIVRKFVKGTVMQDSLWSAEEEELIIWNSSLAIRDFVTIGRVEVHAHKRHAWLDDPYDMVGPFCLDEFERNGQISFAACIVMSRQRWQNDQMRLRQESFAKRKKSEKEVHERLKQFNRRKQMHQTKLQKCSEQEYRELLNLPIDGVLELSQIKTAYKRVAKIAHPDVGGSQEHFVRITEARDALLKIF
jgi:hypothetical protein